jgi:hypothetical protein
MPNAAGDRHARLGEAELGPDHVDDALLATRRAVEADARLLGVPLERDHHLLGQRVGQGPLLVVGRDDVVDGGDGAFGEAHRHVHLAQHCEGLGARDLVDQVETDEELGLTSGQLAHAVRVPDLVEETPARHGPRK